MIECPNEILEDIKFTKKQKAALLDLVHFYLSAAEFSYATEPTFNNYVNWCLYSAYAYADIIDASDLVKNHELWLRKHQS